MTLRTRIQQLSVAAWQAASAAREAGEPALALDLYAAAERLDTWVAAQGLTVHPHKPTVPDVHHTPEHRAKLSASRFAAPGRMAAAEHWMAYARKAGLPSLRAVARALDVEPTFLSAVERGRKRMPLARAEKFEELTGYPAKRWPQ